jgi:hypothetical protein
VESSNDIVLIDLSMCIFESQGRLATAADAIELKNSSLVPGLQLVYSSRLWPDRVVGHLPEY